MPLGETIHAGHRERMREKFLTLGAGAFASYELLEMLLYAVIPYRDTNPVAKQLLARFGSVDGVLSAGEELTTAEGVGKRTAELIAAVGRADMAAFAPEEPDAGKDLSTFEKAGRRVVASFAADGEQETVRAFYLNNRLELIAEEILYTGIPFSSGGVKPAPFVRGAMRVRASAVLVAHNHPHGPAFPTPGDRETHKMLECAFRAADILFPEDFVVTGSEYCGVVKSAMQARMGQGLDLRRFFAEEYATDDRGFIDWIARFFRGEAGR